LTIVNDDTYQITSQQNLDELKLVDEYGQYTPMTPVTLTSSARDAALIP